jgi:hypothetical protein
MSYDTTQAGVYALVIASGLFDESNAKEEDWTVLDARGTDISAVIWMAGDTQEADAFDDHGEYGTKQALHEVGVTVAVKIKTGKDSAAINTLRETVDTLAAYIRARPLLAGVTGVKDSGIIRITRRMGINKSRDAASATHWASTVVVRVHEQFDVAYVEQGG